MENLTAANCAPACSDSAKARLVRESDRTRAKPAKVIAAIYWDERQHAFGTAGLGGEKSA
jgi:hypothetical protein